MTTEETTQTELFDFAAKHQTDEIELRRLQNRLAARRPRAFVGMVDASWFWASHTGEEGGGDPDSISSGVIPISGATKSNWHIGADIPFVLERSDNPKIDHCDGEIRDVWYTFKVTSEEGFLFTEPDGGSVFVRWGEEGTTDEMSCSCTFRAFETKAEAEDWVSSMVPMLATC